MPVTLALQTQIAALQARIDAVAANASPEDVVMLARQLTAYSWEDRLEDCKVSDEAKHDSRELSIAVWLYDQEAKS